MKLLSLLSWIKQHRLMLAQISSFIGGKIVLGII
jgi:hypothetical protein